MNPKQQSRTPLSKKRRLFLLSIAYFLLVVIIVGVINRPHLTQQSQKQLTVPSVDPHFTVADIVWLTWYLNVNMPLTNQVSQVISDAQTVFAQPNSEKNRSQYDRDVAQLDTMVAEPNEPPYKKTEYQAAYQQYDHAVKAFGKFEKTAIALIQEGHKTFYQRDNQRLVALTLAMKSIDDILLKHPKIMNTDTPNLQPLIGNGNQIKEDMKKMRVPSMRIGTR